MGPKKDDATKPDDTPAAASPSNEKFDEMMALLKEQQKQIRFQNDQIQQLQSQVKAPAVQLASVDIFDALTAALKSKDRVAIDMAVEGFTKTGGRIHREPEGKMHGGYHHVEAGAKSGRILMEVAKHGSSPVTLCFCREDGFHHFGNREEATS